MTEKDDFQERMKEAKSWAAVERDSLFAHAETEALDVDKAWEFGFLQGWMMCLRDQVKENHEQMKKAKWRSDAELRRKMPPPADPGGPVYDDFSDR